MTERSENREQQQPKGAALVQNHGGIAAYSVIPKDMTLDEIRKKFFRCFYPKNLNGTVRVTNLFPE